MARVGEALVALLVGLLLTPVGAVIGSALLFGVGRMFADHPAGLSEFIGMTFYGTIPGLVLAAPVSVIVLPIIYGMMRWRSALNLRHLTLAGAACGLLSVAVATVWIGWISSTGTDRFYWTFMLGVAADGAFVAGVCANCFGRIMRAFRPQAWPSAAVTPTV